MKKKRLDLILLERGLVKNRQRAKSLIMAGAVFSEGKRLDKAGMAVDPATNIEIKMADHPYVSRGGVKLEAVLDRFAIEVEGRKILDIGASTGGFTDCLLRRGASGVTALDVGKGQIDWKLRNDPRVKLIEKFNARDIAPDTFDEKFDVVTIDVSFISLELILRPVAEIVAPGGYVIALVKPQFEAGREEVSKGGIVKDPVVHEKVTQKIREFGKGLGFGLVGDIESPITGAKGNKEFFVVFRKNS